MICFRDKTSVFTSFPNVTGTTTGSVAYTSISIAFFLLSHSKYVNNLPPGLSHIIMHSPLRITFPTVNPRPLLTPLFTNICMNLCFQFNELPLHSHFSVCGLSDRLANLLSFRQLP